MRQLQVRYTVAAISDLQEIQIYISQYNSSAALAIGLAISKTIELLRLFPRKSRKVRYRDWYAMPVTRYPYMIFFRIKRDEIEILHIRHGARRHPGFQDEAMAFAR